MGLVTLPNTLTNGTIADADEVQANDNALRDGVNNVEAEQIVDNTITNIKLDESINIQVRSVEIGVRNFVVDGLDWITTTTSIDLNYTTPAFVCYVEGIRVSNPGFNHAYTALRDTYLDIDGAGNITFSEVTNGGTAPAQAPGTLRLKKVITDVSTVTDVVVLAAVTAFSSEAVSQYKYVECNPDRNTDTPSTPGNQKIFMRFKGFDSTGIFEIDTGEAGVTIDIGNKQVANGFDVLGNPTVTSFLHVYAIRAQDGSQPVAGLASESSTFADVSSFAGAFPPGYDVAIWVGTVWVEDEGHLLPSIQNDNETVFYGGWIRNIWAAADNSKWKHKDLTAFVPLDHANQFELTSRVEAGNQTGIGHQGITPDDATNVDGTAGASFFANGDGEGDTVKAWQTCDRVGIHVNRPQNVSDGTAIGQQGCTAGGPPKGFTITGWRYFHF